ncbi:condensation domain-containing protein [Bacillus sp. SL00103]
MKVLQRSLQQMVQRHESLRTSFTMKWHKPVQIIHEHMILQSLKWWIYQICHLRKKKNKNG